MAEKFLVITAIPKLLSGLHTRYSKFALWRISARNFRIKDGLPGMKLQGDEAAEVEVLSLVDHTQAAAAPLNGGIAGCPRSPCKNLKFASLFTSDHVLHTVPPVIVH